MEKDYSLGQAALRVVVGAILGVAGTLYVQGQRIASLESEVSNLESQLEQQFESGKTADSRTSVVDSSTESDQDETQSSGTEAQSQNAALTTAAWNAFNAGDYSVAITKARECIAEFGAEADRMQQDLDGTVQTPPTGEVTETEKEEILARGPLNDVGTCYYIVGRSAEYLGQVQDARPAYETATRYTYARCWDPQGWFWSSADAARDRLAGLE